MERNNSGSTSSSSSFYVSMYNSQTVVFQRDISGLIEVYLLKVFSRVVPT